MIRKSIQRTAAISAKEWIHIRRDTRSFFLSLVTPLLLIIIFGYALNMDVKHVRMAVYDQDRSSFSRRFIEKFSHTEYLKIVDFVDNYRDADDLINSGNAVLVLVLPPDFTANFKSGRNSKAQLLVDGSDSMSATVAAGYVQAILAQYSIDVQMDRLNHIGISDIEIPVDVRTRIWFNEELESKNFIIPGLVVLILAIISALITSLTISREWERGTMETLITTPVRPFEVVTGKLFPYLIIGILDASMTLLLGYLVFNIHIRGSFLELIILSALFLIGTSSLGILISSATRVQVLSIQFAIIITYLPSFILSGFVFPISNMPAVIRLITYLIPAKYMIAIIKGIAIKGIAAQLLYVQIIFMFVFALLMFTLSIKKMRLTLD